MNMKALALAVVLTMGAGAFLNACMSPLDLPRVHKSWMTKECIRVEDEAAEAHGRAPATCKNLPAKYEVVWIR